MSLDKTLNRSAPATMPNQKILIFVFLVMATASIICSSVFYLHPRMPLMQVFPKGNGPRIHIYAYRLCTQQGASDSQSCVLTPSSKPLIDINFSRYPNLKAIPDSRPILVACSILTTSCLGMFLLFMFLCNVPLDLEAKKNLMFSGILAFFIGILPLVGVHCWFNAFVACFSNNRSGPKLVATLGHGISMIYVIFAMNVLVFVAMCLKLEREYKKRNMKEPAKVPAKNREEELAKAKRHTEDLAKKIAEAQNKINSQKGEVGALEEKLETRSDARQEYRDWFQSDLEKVMKAAPKNSKAWVDEFKKKYGVK